MLTQPSGQLSVVFALGFFTPLNAMPTANSLMLAQDVDAHTDYGLHVSLLSSVGDLFGTTTAFILFRIVHLNI